MLSLDNSMNNSTSLRDSSQVLNHISEDSSTGDFSAIEMPYKMPDIDPNVHRFPFCIVWTPIPVLSWICPIIGHMGIALSTGIIRDFAGPYYVSEDSMAFGWPTKYLELNPSNAKNGVRGWDNAVTDASEVYKGRMHNLFCDNCHSHVAMALNKMKYKNYSCWNMIILAFWITFKGKYVSCGTWVKTWIPFFTFIAISISVFFITKYAI